MLLSLNSCKQLNLLLKTTGIIATNCCFLAIGYHAKHKKDEEMRHRGLHLHSCMMCFFIDLRVACMKKLMLD